MAVCLPFSPATCPALIETAVDVATAPQSVAESAVTAMVQSLNDQLRAGVDNLAEDLAGWLLVPSTAVCPDSPATDAWMQTCSTSGSAAAQLQAWALPVTVVVAVLGLLWQAITLTISRKGEPLLQAVRGLATTALWSGIGIVGTQLALRAGDSYTRWILQQAIFGDSSDPVNTVGTALAGMSLADSYNALILLLAINVPLVLITLTQIVLMIFREGSVIILAGLLQLAAAGSFTRLTSGWLPRITGWMLALIAYKPIAASVYATAFALWGADGTRNAIMGLAVMILAVAAMPVTMKFFNWTVGSVASGSSSLGIIGSAAAAGLHAGGALRGIGGHRATDHAAYMDSHGPSGSRPGGTTAPAPGPDPTPPPARGPGLASAAASVGMSAAGATAAGAATGGVGFAAAAGVEAVNKFRQAADHAVNTVGEATQGR